MKKIFASVFVLVFMAFTTACCDDEEPFNNNLAGEWQPLSFTASADSLTLMKYVFRTDGTGEIAYGFIPYGRDAESFSVKIKDLRFTTNSEISLTSESFIVKHKQVSGVGKVPDSIVIYHDTYLPTFTRYIKHLDADSLVFTDRYGGNPLEFKKLK